MVRGWGESGSPVPPRRHSPLPLQAQVDTSVSVIPSLSVLMALGSACAPSLFRRLGRIPVITGFAIGIATAIAGAPSSVFPYPWTDLVVLLVGLTGGVLLGRIVPPKPISFLALLISLSLL